MLSHQQYGKLTDNVALCTGHTAPVLDTDWNPFNDHVIVSGSEDAKVRSAPDHPGRETLQLILHELYLSDA